MRSRNAVAHQISTQSNNPRWSYCDLNMSNLGDVRHVGFDQKWIFTIQFCGLQNQ